MWRFGTGSRKVLITLAAGLLCGGCSYSRMPRIDPSGQRLFIEDPAPTVPQWEDPSAEGTSDECLAVTLTPSKTVFPVGSEVVLLAGVVGPDRYLRTNQRIEWSLAPGGVGHFVAVGKNGWADWLAGDFTSTKKIDNSFAVGSTSRKYLRLGRGTSDTTDDVCVLRGQAWITLTSPVEGTSHVTVYAPSAKSWSNHTRSAKIYWVDAEVCFPPPAIHPAGSQYPLTTTVSRHTDAAPCSGWIVRYEVLDGPPAGFAPNGSSSVEVVTDAAGRATIEILQAEPRPGTNKIGIEVIRPATPGDLGGKPLVAGRGSTLATWTSADLAVRIIGPAAANIGEALTYAIEVSNPGDLPAADVTVTDELPPELTYLDSDPPAEQIAGRLQWRIGQLGAGERRQVQLRCRADDVGSVTHCADATAAGGLTASHCTTTTVTSPQLQVKVVGPTQAAVGSDVTFQVTVTNISNASIGKLLLKDHLSPGMEHATGAPIVAKDIGPLEPGQSQAIETTLRMTGTGRLCHTVEVTGDGGIRAVAEACVEVSQDGFAPGSVPTEAPQPPLDGTATDGQSAIQVVKKLIGPAVMNVGQTAEFYIEVTNTGSQTRTGVMIVDQYDAALKPVSATKGSQLANQRLTWTIDSLAPGDRQRFDVDCQGLGPSTRACNRVTVTSREGDRVEAEACVEIRAGQLGGGQPGGGLAMTVRDVPDQITAGRGVTYRIEITNDGPMPQTNVLVEAVVPDGMSPSPIGISGRTRPTIAGQTIRFAPIAEMAPGAKELYYIRANTRQPGEYTFSATLRGDGLAQPLTVTEQTTVFPRPTGP